MLHLLDCVFLAELRPTGSAIGQGLANCLGQQRVTLSRPRTVDGLASDWLKRCAGSTLRQRGAQRLPPAHGAPGFASPRARKAFGRLQHGGDGTTRATAACALSASTSTARLHNRCSPSIMRRSANTTRGGTSSLFARLAGGVLMSLASASSMHRRLACRLQLDRQRFRYFQFPKCAFSGLIPPPRTA